MKKYSFTFLLIVLLVAHATTDPAASTVELLVTPTPQSLRGQVVDLDDVWSRTRLLAHFGEHKLAYDMLRRRPPSDIIEPDIERFEARLLTEIGLYAKADSLLALQTRIESESDYYVLCLQRARLNQLADQPDRALRFLRLIENRSEVTLDPYRDLLLLEAMASAGDVEGALAVGERRLAAGVPLSMSPLFEEALFDTYVNGEEFERAEHLVNTLKANKTRASSFAAIFAREVELRLALGDTVAAIEAAMITVERAKKREPRSLAVATIMAAVSPKSVTVEGLLMFGEILLADRQLADVDHIVDELDKRELAGEDAERRRLLHARLFYVEKRYSKAFGLLDEPFATASLERTAMLYKARIYRKTGQAVPAADAYAAFAKKFPYDAKAAESLFVAQDLYARSGRQQESRAALQQISATYPSHRYGTLATLKQAAYYSERNQHDRAIAMIEASVRGTNRQSEDLLYYLADAYRVAGDTESAAKVSAELRDLDPTSFYVDPTIAPTFAQPLMGSDGRIVLDGEAGLMPFLAAVFTIRVGAFETVRDKLKPISDSAALDQHEPYLRRGRLFLELGFRDWAENELNVLERQNPLPPRVNLELGVLYDDFATHWKSTRAFQRVYYSFSREERRQLDGEFKLLMHPIPFPALVFENCSRYGIQPHLVYAMMRQESRFQVDAISSAGASGLMQLMPLTSKEVASRLGFADGVQHNILSPEVNLTFGIWYASHLLDRTSRDAVMMLCAYNAGMGNARRWFDGRSALIETVDGIDYNETRDYVKKIVENAHVYHSFYFGAVVVDGDRVR